MEYKISIDRVVDCFLELAGTEALSDGRIFCRTAVETVEARLDSSKDFTSAESSVAYAAATLAFYRYTLKNADPESSIKAGDISVTDVSEKAVANAKALMDEAFCAISGLLKPKSFAFVKTEV